MKHGVEGPNFGAGADFEEWGILPKEKGVAGREKIQANYDETVRLAKEGKIEEISAEHQLKVSFF